jgi:hypothetical protein
MYILPDSIHDALWEIVQKVAETDTTYEDDDGNHWCHFCTGEDEADSFSHAPDCIVLAARALVETQQKYNAQKAKRACYLT